MRVWQSGPPPCAVCGSSGFRARFSDNRIVCRAHVDVCDHLKDPCPICDGTDQQDEEAHHA